MALSLRERPLAAWRSKPLASAERLTLVCVCSGAVAAAYRLGFKRTYKACVGFIFSYVSKLPGVDSIVMAAGLAEEMEGIEKDLLGDGAAAASLGRLRPSFRDSSAFRFRRSEKKAARAAATPSAASRGAVASWIFRGGRRRGARTVATAQATTTRTTRCPRLASRRTRSSRASASRKRARPASRRARSGAASTTKTARR